MRPDEAPARDVAQVSPYARLPEPIEPDAMTTSTDPDLPSIEGTGAYEQQEAFLRSYGTG